jgi:hypothetical protein
MNNELMDEIIDQFKRYMRAKEHIYLSYMDENFIECTIKDLRDKLINRDVPWNVSFNKDMTNGIQGTKDPIISV